MKKSCLLLTVILLFHLDTRAQATGDKPRYAPYEVRYHGRKLGAVTITGLVCMGAGAITCIVGEQKIEWDARNKPSGGIGEGIVPTVMGALLFLSGTGMAIGGAVYDHNRIHRLERLSLISPRKNSIGIAYSF